MAGDERDAPDDRRRAERAPVNAEFESLTSATFISDLSELGLFIQTRRRAPIGTVVELNFTVLVDDPVVLSGRGRVVRHQQNPAGMGIEFIDPSPQLVLRINDVVGRLRPRILGAPVGAPDPNDEVTVHRAPMPGPEHGDPELEMQQTGIYPSIRIQIHEPEDSGEGSTMEISGDDLEVAEGDPATAPGTSPNRTLNLRATDVEIVDDDGDDEER